LVDILCDEHVGHVRQVRALLKDSQYDAAIAEARAAREAHNDNRSVREVIHTTITPMRLNHDHLMCGGG
jgi:hypothetical protein